MAYWGSNPFTNYQTTPYGMGWQSPNSGSFGGGTSGYPSGMPSWGGWQRMDPGTGWGGNMLQVPTNGTPRGLYADPGGFNAPSTATSAPSMMGSPSWGSPWGGMGGFGGSPWGGGMGGLGGFGGVGPNNGGFGPMTGLPNYMGPGPTTAFGNQGGQPDFASMIQRLIGGGMGQMGYGSFNQTKPLQIPGPGTPGPQIDPGIGTGAMEANTFNTSGGAASPSAPNGGLYANVIHNSTFDGALDPNNIPDWVRQAQRFGY